MTPVRVGVVGVGRIGAMHAQNVAAEPGVSELLIADADPARCRELAERVGARAVPTFDELLDASPDGVVIATGTPIHPRLITACVEAGVTVFCEKPVAPTVEESLPVLSSIAEHHGVVQIGHQRRFDRGYREAKRLVDANELGRIHSFHAVTRDVVPPPVEFIASSGGLFVDCSIHDFDIIRWITGREIVEVYALGSNTGDPAIREAGDIDTGLAVVTLDDGMIGSVSASRYNGAGHDVRLEVQGSASTVVVGLDERSALTSAEIGTTFPSGRAHTTFAERFADAYKDEMTAFVELVAGEGCNPCPPEDAVAAARVADAAQASLRTGQPVRISP